MSRKKKIIYFWVILILIVTAIVYGSYFYERLLELDIISSEFNINKTIVNKKEEPKKEITEDRPKLSCPEEWRDYYHDVLGIAFCYPSIWGEAKTEPVNNITKLEGIVDEYDYEENAYYNSLYINFTEMNKVNMRIFNENYKGEFYPNAFSYKYGYVDNIPEMRAQNNVCAYKIDFDHENEGYENKLQEVENECKLGIKTALIENKQKFSINLYTYNLKSYVYQKLDNSYFDNILVTYSYGHLRQTPDKITNKNAFFFQARIPEKDYKQEKEIFTQFIKSIHTYIPPNDPSVAKEDQGEEDDGLDLISKYYGFLEEEKFQEAYDLKTGDTLESFLKFQETYKNVHRAEPYDFQKTEKGYKFYLTYQNHNEDARTYYIEVAIIEGKIKFISEEEYLTDIIREGFYEAYAVRREDKNYLILVNNGEKKIIAEGEAEYGDDYKNLGKVVRFDDVKFSPQADYLLYQSCGWEWCSNSVYDIGQEKIVLEDSGDIFGFTKDEEYFYACSNIGMISTLFGEVYLVPEFEVKYSAQNDLDDLNYSVSCQYEEDDNSIKFEFKGMQMNPDLPQNKDVTIIYYLDEERAEKI